MTARPSAGSGGIERPSLPSGVAFTTRSAGLPSASCEPDPLHPRTPGRRRAQRRRRLGEFAHGDRDRRGTAFAQRERARRGPRRRPPGSARHSPAASKPGVGAQEALEPGASVFSPTTAPSVITTVFTAWSSRASSDSRRRGRRLDPCAASSRSRPRTPARGGPRTARGSPSGGTGNGTYTRSMPNARNAALWIAGDRLCATGHPMTPSDPRPPRRVDHRRFTRGIHRRCVRCSS